MHRQITARRQFEEALSHPSVKALLYRAPTRVDPGTEPLAKTELIEQRLGPYHPERRDRGREIAIG